MLIEVYVPTSTSEQLIDPPDDTWIHGSDGEVN